MRFVDAFKELRNRYVAEGKTYPTLRAWTDLVEDYEEWCESDDYYRTVEWRKDGLLLYFVDCYTAGVVSNIQLWVDGELVLSVGQE